MVELTQLKSLKKELKQFQKVSKNEQEGKLKARDILKRVMALLKDKELINSEKNISSLKKTKEMLILYISNVEQIEKINKKWDSKK